MWSETQCVVNLNAKYLTLSSCISLHLPLTGTSLLRYRRLESCHCSWTDFSVLLWKQFAFSSFPLICNIICESTSVLLNSSFTWACRIMSIGWNILWNGLLILKKMILRYHNKIHSSEIKWESRPILQGRKCLWKSLPRSCDVLEWFFIKHNAFVVYCSVLTESSKVMCLYLQLCKIGISNDGCITQYKSNILWRSKNQKQISSVGSFSASVA